jgi:uncharacterized membrane protein
MNYLPAAGLGAVSGLRSMSGPAILANAASTHRIDLSGTPLAWLGSGHARATSAALAVGELIVDKLPSTPDRLNPPSLLVRSLAGALCGYAVAGRGSSQIQKWISAATGATAALAASWAGSSFRKNVRMPKMAAALAEDAVAMATGAVVIAAIRDGERQTGV